MFCIDPPLPVPSPSFRHLNERKVEERKITKRSGERNKALSQSTLRFNLFPFISISFCQFEPIFLSTFVIFQSLKPKLMCIASHRYLSGSIISFRRSISYSRSSFQPISVDCYGIRRCNNVRSTLMLEIDQIYY